MKDKHGQVIGLPPYTPIKGKLILECTGTCKPLPDGTNRMATFYKKDSPDCFCQQCKDKEEREDEKNTFIKK